MALGHNPSIVTSGLVLCLDAGNPRSYSGTGTQWNDISDTVNNSTLTNGPSYTSGTNGYFSFDGVDDYATCASKAAYAFGTGDFTLECWYYPTSFSTYSHMIALPDQNTFALKANATDGAIYFYSPTFTTYPTTGWTLTLNTWNHVVFVRSSSVAYPYLNGVALTSKSSFTNNFSAQACNIHNGYPSEFATCRISVVRMYNIGLSATQVLQNFNASRGRYGV